eukprot:1996486-Rhodomonas_salina.1
MQSYLGPEFDFGRHPIMYTVVHVVEVRSRDQNKRWRVQLYHERTRGPAGTRVPGYSEVPKPCGPSGELVVGSAGKIFLGGGAEIPHPYRVRYPTMQKRIPT